MNQKRMSEHKVRKHIQSIAKGRYPNSEESILGLMNVYNALLNKLLSDFDKNSFLMETTPLMHWVLNAFCPVDSMVLVAQLLLESNYTSDQIDRCCLQMSRWHGSIDSFATKMHISGLESICGVLVLNRGALYYPVLFSGIRTRGISMYASLKRTPLSLIQALDPEKLANYVLLRQSNSSTTTF